MPESIWGARDVTRGKLNRMLKYFCRRKIPVEIRYIYNLSTGGQEVRRYRGVIESYEIKGNTPERNEHFEYVEYGLIIRLVDGTVAEEYIPWDSEFIDRGVIRWIENGPYCYFSIKCIDK